jgi:hypothetical protein
MVTAVDIQSAIQLVDSNISMTTDSVMKATSVNVVSRVTSGGEQSLLIGKESLLTVDSELRVVGDNVLINNRTGTKAVILEDQNMALVGNEIIESDNDTLIVRDVNGQVFYNIKVISSLMSNTYLSSIGAKSFYALGDLQPEVYKRVVSPDGTRLGTAITGAFEFNAVEEGEEPEEIRIQADFINVSQLTSGSNLLIKEFVRPDRNGISTSLRLVVEWELVLPSLYDSAASGGANQLLMDENWGDAEVNPTIGDITRFFSTRPNDDHKQLQDWWDNNIGINNAIANVMYGTSGREYITCGYLVPSITLLFSREDGNAEKPALPSAGSLAIGVSENVSAQDREATIEDLMSGVDVEYIVGAWFQEVGEEVPSSWVDRFFGSVRMYNRILSKSSSSPDYWGKYSDDIVVDEAQQTYRLASNKGSKFYPDKDINFDWYPAWVHVAFNNFPNEGSQAVDYANTEPWRFLAAHRRFYYLKCAERRSDGMLFYNQDGNNSGSPAWMLLPTGALYRQVDGYQYRSHPTYVTVNTRSSVPSFSDYVGKTVKYEGSWYYVASFDEMYLQLVSLDTITATYDEASGTFLASGEDAGIVGYNTIKQRFVGASGSAANSDHERTIAGYSITANRMPTAFYAMDTPILQTSTNGSFSVKKYSAGVAGDSLKLNIQTLERQEYRNLAVSYHPVIRLSVIGWDVREQAGEYSFEFRKILPALLFNGVYTSGLTKTVLDSSVADAVDAKPLESLPVGTVVLFGDTRLYKVEGGFVTEPIPVSANNRVPKAVSGGTSVSENLLQSQISSRLGLPIDFNGRSETVSDHLSYVSLAPRVNHEDFDYTRTVVAADLESGLVPLVATGTSELQPLADGDLVDSVSYYVEFDEGLLAMDVDPTRKYSELLLTAAASGKGLYLSIAFLAPDPIDAKIRDALLLNLVPTDFKPLPNQRELKDAFTAANREATKRDALYWVRTLLCFILGYLMMMVLILWYTLKLNSARLVLEQVRHPTSGGRGPDIVRILTFGVLGVDDEVSGGRLFVSLMILCIIFAFIMVL